MRKLRLVEIALLCSMLVCVLLRILVVKYKYLADQAPTIAELMDRNVEFETDFYGLRYHGDSANYIDAHVLYYGAFEKPMLNWMKDTANALERDDLVFLDVGANMGHHTLFASLFAAQVHAFEPYSPVLEKLRQAVDRNSLANVTIHPIGLGATAEMLEFFDPPSDNNGVGSFVRGFQDRSPSKSYLQIVVGDDYLAEHLVSPVDMIKIDVEGYEKSVLRGLRKTLAKDRPVIILELTVNAGEDFLFQSSEELRGAFPEFYEFAELIYPEQRVGFKDGHYEVVPFRPSFDKEFQYSVIAYPKDLAASIPRDNEQGAQVQAGL